ncbi:MAG TPA: PDZ domain-containing protein [Segetibacter sp.]
MKKKIFYILILIFSASATLNAQKTWTSTPSSSAVKFYNSSDLESYKFVGTATYFGADFTYNKLGGVISKIYQTSPASDFNFKVDDIVTAIGKFKIISAEDYEKAIQFYKPTDEVAVSYIRDGEETSRIVVLDKIDVFKSEKGGKKLEIPSQHLSGTKETIKVLETGKN